MAALKRILIAIAGVVILTSPAMAHTTLVSSTPTKNSIIARAPFVARLVFSEPIEVALAKITITDPSGRTFQLTTRGDPHDVHAVIADVSPSDTGTYKLQWHVVSADGHAVGGSFSYRVTGTPADSVAAPGVVPGSGAESSTDSMVRGGDETADQGMRDMEASTSPEVPLDLAVLRAAASFATLAIAGVLADFAWILPIPADDRRRRGRTGASWIAGAALMLTAAHAISWAGYATDHAGFDAMRAALTGSAGRAECARVLFCALTVWSLVLVRNTRGAAVTAIGAMLATAAIGHSAAIRPELLIPIKAVHLASAALWLGGLILLARGPAADDVTVAGYADLALRVSVVALTAVILVALSGIAQTLIVIRPAQLISTPYGLLSLGKVGVLIILIGFGVAHRLRNVPAVQRGEAAHVLKRTVAWEIAVIAVAFVIAGVLAYTAPPENTNVSRDMQTAAPPTAAAASITQSGS
jgi:copper transport protein